MRMPEKKCKPFFNARRLRDKSLHDTWHTFHRLMAKRRRNGRYDPPSEKFKPFLFRNDLEHLFRLIAL